MMHNEKFKYDASAEGKRVRISLKGIIDEDTDFDPLKSVTAGKPITINFKEVMSINSCGIRTWVNFLKDMKGTEISYEECPALIVRQMNMVPSFLGHAKVSSIYVPYVCEECEAEKMVLIPSERFNHGNPEIPESMKCESCKAGEMELDGNPKQYFAFAR